MYGKGTKKTVRLTTLRTISYAIVLNFFFSVVIFIQRKNNDVPPERAFDDEKKTDRKSYTFLRTLLFRN